MLKPNPNFNLTLSLSDPYYKGFACAAINSGLRSILIFNSPYSSLETSADILAQMLECVTEQKVEKIRLGVSEVDDDLWGTVVLASDPAGSPIVRSQGLLADPSDLSLVSKARLRLIIIPDLSKLSLAASRACVILMGADVAHLERHGQHEAFRPNICWLASCATDEVGAVSPHLLDRFALRFTWRASGSEENAIPLLRQTVEDESSDGYRKVVLSREIQDQIQKAMQIRVTYTDQAIESIFDLMAVVRVYSPRREIALARLALVSAQLEGASQVDSSHVDAAADLLGLKTALQPLYEPSQLPIRPADSAHILQTIWNPTDVDEKPSLSPDAQEEGGSIEPVYEPNQTDEMGMLETDLAPSDPYPEDKAPIKREVASLRLPPLRYATISSHQGTVIGVEKTNTFRDLAVISTIFAAAPFQPVRRTQKAVSNHRLILSAADLRRYRREPVAEQMLLLLLDYTSLCNCNWLEALQPYMSWAYVERASINVVQVGAEAAIHYLRAEVVAARSILVPSIGAALDAKSGKATPLAHGMELVLDTLRKALQHGRSTVQRALLVVVSDGRGNISLKASHDGEVTTPIGREGIDDALRIAQNIRDLKNVHAVLLNPQPKYYAELPYTLASALGAQVVNIEKSKVGRSSGG